MRFEWLSPENASYANSQYKYNNRSCVMRVGNVYRCVLFAGDIEREVEMDFADRLPQAIQSDVLVVPHHGSKTSSTNTFNNAVQLEVKPWRKENNLYWHEVFVE